MATPPWRLVFVCMGNICRSPTAHGVMRHKIAQHGWQAAIDVASAGTHAYHVGEPPDPRSQHHARLRGYDLSDLRAQALTPTHCAQADLLLVMDWDNLALTEALCPPGHHRKIKRLTEFCTRHNATVVPDPYLGGAAGFEQVLDLVEDACDGLLVHLAGLPKKSATA